MRSALVLALAIPGAALAGRPLDTEDATTLDDGACQLESWADRARGNVTDFYFVPACTYSGVEWQAGAVRTSEGGHGAGGRYAILPTLSVDLTYVTRAGGASEESLRSVGFHGETDPFLP